MPTKNSLNSVEAMCRHYCKEFPEVRDISVSDLKRIAPKPMVLVDVRPLSERIVSTIPGSISQAEFESNSEAYRGKLIVPFCTIGYRSGQFTRKLQRHGWNTLNLRGGILAWCHAGQPVVTSDGGSTRRVHVYGRKWNRLPKQYEGVW